MPSTANTPWLPFPHEMGEDQGIRPEDLRPGGRLAWTTYMGGWVTARIHDKYTTRHERRRCARGMERS